MGRDLDNPRDTLPQDISLTAISGTIEINLKQMIDKNENFQTAGCH